MDSRDDFRLRAYAAENRITALETALRAILETTFDMDAFDEAGDWEGAAVARDRFDIAVNHAARLIQEGEDESK